MIKRADGSSSPQGFYDNLRKKAAENKRTGAKPNEPSPELRNRKKDVDRNYKKKSKKK